MLGWGDHVHEASELRLRHCTCAGFRRARLYGPHWDRSNDALCVHGGVGAADRHMRLGCAARRVASTAFLVAAGAEAFGDLSRRAIPTISVPLSVCRDGCPGDADRRGPHGLLSM